MIEFGFLSYALTFGALNSLAVAVLLLNTRGNRSANRLLAALLAVLALRLVPYIIGYAGAYDVWPWLSFAPFDLPLFIGPLLYLYVTRLVSDRLPPGWWWHLVPGLTHFAIYFALFAFVPLSVRHAIVREHIDPWVAPLITGAALTGIVVYGASALRALRAYQQWLDDNVSNREEYRLTWLRVLLSIMALQALVWAGFALVDTVGTPLSYYDEFPFYLVQSVAAWLLGLLAWRAADLHYPVSIGTEPSEPTLVLTEAGGRLSSLHHDDDDATTPLATYAAPEHAPPTAGRGNDWHALGHSYRAALEQHGWWRDPQLTLERLAQHLASNTSYVSKALNQGLGQGFNECINRLRVAGVAADLRAGSTLDLVQIGFDNGFNSKASFQRAFVLYMQQTPSAYRDAVRGASEGAP